MQLFTIKPLLMFKFFHMKCKLFGYTFGQHSCVWLNNGAEVNEWSEEKLSNNSR